MEMSPRTAIELAIAVEEMGGRLYAHLARTFRQDPELHSVFSKLAEDEHDHLEHFTKLLALVSSADRSTLSEEQKAYLRATALTDFFGAKGGPFERRDDICTPEDALAKALELEKATLGYYRELRDEIGQNDAIDALVEAERNHVMGVANALNARASRERSQR